MTDLVDVLAASRLGIATHKLWQFRRHPDWWAAFDKVREPFMVELPDGSRGFHDRDKFTLVELADQEFIDEIIRRRGEQ